MLLFVLIDVLSPVVMSKDKHGINTIKHISAFSNSSLQTTAFFKSVTFSVTFILLVRLYCITYEFYLF